MGVSVSASTEELVAYAVAAGLFVKIFDLIRRIRGAERMRFDFWLGFLVDPAFSGFVVWVLSSSGILFPACGASLSPWVAALIGFTGWAGFQTLQSVIGLFFSPTGSGQGEDSKTVLTWRDGLFLRRT